jgi:hypothetical protein
MFDGVKKIRVVEYADVPAARCKVKRLHRRGILTFNDFLNKTLKKTDNLPINVTLRRVRVAIVAVEK